MQELVVTAARETGRTARGAPDQDAALREL
jgi:hypothetical protein